MASTAAVQPSTAAQSSPQQAPVGARSENAPEELSSSPLEMRTLSPSSGAPAAAGTTAQAPADTATPTSAAAPTTDTAVPHTTDTTPAQPSQAAVASAAKTAPTTTLNRAEAEAIGPSTDTPTTVLDTSNGPVVVIMLLLPSTGARHPYKIDEKYLKKRSVDVTDMDPYNISVYTLKELIWRDWREECRFQTDSPNVVHMTVKPQEAIDDEDAKTGKGTSRRDGEEEATAGCRCVLL
ncbi:hypothetical protein ACEQ8H_005524 [Pleosporales sp. CAS-2024a]